jgi:hypothetical protein
MRETYLSARNSGALLSGGGDRRADQRGDRVQRLSIPWFEHLVARRLRHDLATSAAWTAMHVQYDGFTLAQIFLIGLCSAGSAGRAGRLC